MGLGFDFENRVRAGCCRVWPCVMEESDNAHNP